VVKKEEVLCELFGEGSETREPEEDKREKSAVKEGQNDDLEARGNAKFKIVGSRGQNAKTGDETDK